MKIALIGYGKMGQLIERLAITQGHEIIAKFSSQQPCQSTTSLQNADVCMDFSHPDLVLNHLQLCAHNKTNLIIGTTGWDKQYQIVRDVVAHSQMGCLYAPNFSIGIHLFTQIVAHATHLLTQFDDYDIGAVEYHHRQKVDSPSGTAKNLTQYILDQTHHLKSLEFASVRCGSIPGTHTILFDGPVDTITLTHQARNREGFARGAIQAAEWIIGKKGFFTLNDMLSS